MDAFQAAVSRGPDFSKRWPQVACMSRAGADFVSQTIWPELWMLKTEKAVFCSWEQVGWGGPLSQLASSRAAFLFGMLIFKG